MDVLADLATAELLQAEIATLQATNKTLHDDLVESQDHCQRLEEEASLQLSVEREHDETDTAFKKRKQAIYNRRSYKKGKKIGSAKEENQRLITELESLRGQLIVCEEKCKRLSEEGMFPVLDRLPGESNEQLRKRRQHVYNQRSYLKRKKQMQVKKGVPEPRRPTSVASLPADNPSMKGLDLILSKYTKTHPKNWPVLFQKSRDIRLLNVSHWINDSGLIKESNPKRASVTLDSSSKILPSAEIKRDFAVQFLDPTVKEWCDLFFIRPSTLVPPGGLRRTAGYGLFSARPFKCGDRIAVYIGEIFDLQKLPSPKRTCYSLIFNIDKTAAPLKVRQASSTKLLISDAGYCPKDSPDNMKRPPVYFGTHYANDPKWRPDGNHLPNRVTRQTIIPDYNIEVGNDLVATTICDIEVGEELFWDYTDGSGTMYGNST
jgi:hypothetical protein